MKYSDHHYVAVTHHFPDFGQSATENKAASIILKFRKFKLKNLQCLAKYDPLT